MINKAAGITCKKVVFDRSDYDDLLGQAQSELLELRTQVQTLKNELRSQRERHQLEIDVVDAEMVAFKESIQEQSDMSGSMAVLRDEVESMTLANGLLVRELEQLRSRNRVLIQTVRGELDSIIEDVVAAKQKV